jgi:hypothetical protein
MSFARRAVPCLLSLASLAGWATGANPPDLAREVARWQEFANQVPADYEDGKAIREGSRPLLDDARTALATNRPWLALSRLSVVWGNLAAARWVESQDPAARKSLTALEKEWQRAGGPPAADSDVTTAAFASSFASAAGRALAEAALLEAGGYYEASLEYGRNTVADAGFFYLGAMRGQHEFARLATSLAAPRDAQGKALPPPALRDLSVEIAALENELLQAYRPPASIESHPIFIRVSALLKEAHELNDGGRRLGALHRLLDARHRLSRLTRPAALSFDEAKAREAEVRARLAKSGVDPSLLLLFVEAASADADPSFARTGTVPGPAGELAKAVFDDLVPLYFAALGPAPPKPPDIQAQATVTLIRWPYT